MSTTDNETAIHFTLMGYFFLEPPKLPGFTINERIHKYEEDCPPVGIDLTYTHEVTNTELRFFVSSGRNPHTKGYYVLSSYRFSAAPHQDPVAHELINPDRKKKLGVHGSGAYFGPKEKILVPIKDVCDEHEFKHLVERVDKVLKSALETMNHDVTDVTEEDDMDKKLAAVVEIDKTLAEYQELLHNEFNN